MTTAKSSTKTSTRKRPATKRVTDGDTGLAGLGTPSLSYTALTPENTPLPPAEKRTDMDDLNDLMEDLYEDEDPLGPGSYGGIDLGEDEEVPEEENVEDRRQICILYDSRRNSGHIGPLALYYDRKLQIPESEKNNPLKQQEVSIASIQLNPGANFYPYNKGEMALTQNKKYVKGLIKKKALTYYVTDNPNKIVGCSQDYREPEIALQIIGMTTRRNTDWLQISESRDDRPGVVKAARAKLQRLKDIQARKAQGNPVGGNNPFGNNANGNTYGLDLVGG